MIKNYFIIALRNIKRNLGYSSINVFGLALGITCSFVLLLMIDYYTGFDIDHLNGDRIYRLNSIRTTNGVPDFQPGVPPPLPDVLKSDVSGLEDVLFIVYDEGGLITIETEGERELYSEPSGIAFTTANFFQFYNRAIISGAVGAFEHPNEVILSKKLAEKYFGFETAINRTLKLNNEWDLKVVAIMDDVPPNTNFPFEMIVSYESIRDQRAEYGWNSTHSNDQCYVLLDVGRSKKEVEAQLPAFIENHFGDRPEKIEMYLQPLAELSFDDRFSNFKFQTISKASIWAMGIIALFLLLTASINFINLSTAVAIRRSKEVGIRKVMGSQRSQLMIQYLGETLLITFLALLISIGITEIGLIKINSFMETNLHVNLMDPLQLSLLATIWFVVSIASGAYPAVLLSGFSPALALKNRISSRSVGGISLRRGLVVFQFIISQVLIVGTIIMLTQMNYFENKDLGFNKEAIITLPLFDDDNSSKKRILKSEIDRLAGVDGSTLCLTPPSNDGTWNTHIRLEGIEGERFRVQEKIIDENFLPLFDIPIVAGRALSPSDTVNGWLVNEELVRIVGMEFPDQILGRKLYMGKRELPVVGVVRDFHTTSLNDKIYPTLLFSNLGMYQSLSIKISPGQFNTLIKNIESTWKAQYEDYLFSYEFLDQEIANFYQREKRMSSMLVVFSIIAIVIGCLGLYGLISYLANEKEKEIGVRKVLGASANQIMAIFSKELMVLIAISFIIASPLAGYVMNQWLQNFEYHIELNWMMFTGGIAVALLVSFATVGYRTFKAAYTNPVDTLRSE